MADAGQRRGRLHENDQRSGRNGRANNLISLDDGYVPPRTVEQSRLVEQEALPFFSAHWHGDQYGNRPLSQ
jgi:hypothetical protein